MIVTLLTLIGLSGSAFATPASWSEGRPAAESARFLIPLANAPEVTLPPFLAKEARGDALLVYFSPQCPHCWAVTPELNALADRLGSRAKIIGVATSSSTERQIADYRERFGVRFVLIRDQENAFAEAIGAQSTPSAVLLNTDKKGKTQVIDGYFPYQPTYDALVEMRLSKNPWDAFRPDEYQGNAVCGSCHVQEMGSWYLSYHSLAWPTLMRAEKAEDPSCTSCHVTGAGHTTGWSGEAHSPLVNVGCEACHGPGGPHDGRSIEAKDTCESCHDADHSIAFSYEKGLPFIDHYVINTVEESELRSTRERMFNGELPRPLLAFPSGPNAGSTRCKTCHETEHSDWLKSPHARAMKTLSSEQVNAPASVARHGQPDGAAQSDLGCVKCHTLQAQSGPLPSDLSGYKTNEAIGCEACHGPGLEHINAGGDPDKILGLGESCPVCVLEAICTRCHTPMHDPNWSLDKSLPLVQHQAHVIPQPSTSP